MKLEYKNIIQTPCCTNGVNIRPASNGFIVTASGYGYDDPDRVGSQSGTYVFNHFGDMLIFLESLYFEEVSI